MNKAWKTEQNKNKGEIINLFHPYFFTFLTSDNNSYCH